METPQTAASNSLASATIAMFGLIGNLLTMETGLAGMTLEVKEWISIPINDKTFGQQGVKEPQTSVLRNGEVDLGQLKFDTTQLMH